MLASSRHWFEQHSIGITYTLAHFKHTLPLFYPVFKACRRIHCVSIIKGHPWESPLTQSALSVQDLSCTPCALGCYGTDGQNHTGRGVSWWRRQRPAQDRPKQRDVIFEPWGAHRMGLVEIWASNVTWAWTLYNIYIHCAPECCRIFLWYLCVYMYAGGCREARITHTHLYRSPLYGSHLSGDLKP